jgi:hypothetical protein
MTVGYELAVGVFAGFVTVALVGLAAPAATHIVNTPDG